MMAGKPTIQPPPSLPRPRRPEEIEAAKALARALARKVARMDYKQLRDGN